jgi:hypothetical protein
MNKLAKFTPSARLSVSGGLQAHTRPKGRQIAHQKKTKRIETHQNGAKN